MARKILDITPPITTALQVYPGDTPPSREVLHDVNRGDRYTLSTLRSTVHLGAHADAPGHIRGDGRAIDAQDLDAYVGPCQVIQTGVGRGKILTEDHVRIPIRAERILFGTDSFPDPDTWREDFAGLSPGLIHHLHAQGVRLVGIDTPSVDAFTAEDLPAHRAMFRCDMAVLEGLVLNGVPEGVYELIALPLKLVGFDASPVRAILRSV